MPASSMFEMERPTSNPNNTAPLDDQRALQLALELSLLGIQNDALGQQQLQHSQLPTSMADEFSSISMDDRAKRSQNMTECVAVPSSEHVAEIVGRQGCKIKALRAKTNTYIKTPVRGEEPVFVVTGRKEDVAMAKREILSAAEHFSQIRACRKNNLNGSMAPGPPTNIPGQVTIQVRVPYRVVGLVVGPKGATIKRIQQQSHTYIVTPSRDKEPVFEVTGLPESVDQARKEIEAHIAMRTGGLLDQEETGNVTVAAAAAAATIVGTGHRHQHDFASSQSLDNLFTSNEFVASLYKLNASGINGFGGNGAPSLGLNGGSSLNGLNSLGSTATLNALNSLGGPGSLGNTLGSIPPIGDINYLLSETGNSILGGSKGVDSSIFSSLGSTMGSKDMNGHLGSLYHNVDEGLGSLGSSMGSSPSFDPSPSSIWGDIGRSISTSVASSNVNSSGGSMSSTLSSLSSLTRRSSSVSGASPPSSRLSPTLECPHAPARRISSEPMNLSHGLPPTTNVNSMGSSPASTPELCLTNGFHSGNLPAASLSSLSSAGLGTGSMSGNSSPTMEKRCRSCCENPIVAALVPCGHNLFCMDCANQLVNDGGKCSHCLEEVTQAIRIFS